MKTFVRFFLYFILLNFLLLSSCVSKDVKKTNEKPTFFPPPPDPPRYQFLTAFSGTADYGEQVSGLDSFLGAASKGYRLKKPYGVSVGKGGMYVVDTQSSVYKWDFGARKVFKIPGDKGLGKLVQPINVSSDSQGNIYVADPVRSAVLKYDRNNFFVKAYSSSKPWKPVDAEFFDGLLYVVDSTHGTGGIHVIDPKSGEFLDVLGQNGPPENRLNIPTNLSIDADGYLYIMDVGRFQVVKYDRDGHYRGNLGGPGDGPGYFGRPRGVDIDREGRIYAVDAAFDIVQVFSPNGQLLIFLGGPGSAPGTLTLPAAVSIDYENVDLFKEYAAPGFEIEYLVFVTSQFHNTNGISVYGFGKMTGKTYLSDQRLHDELIEQLKREGKL